MIINIHGNSNILAALLVNIIMCVGQQFSHHFNVFAGQEFDKFTPQGYFKTNFEICIADLIGITFLYQPILIIKTINIRDIATLRFGISFFEVNAKGLHGYRIKIPVIYSVDGGSA